MCLTFLFVGAVAAASVPGLARGATLSVKQDGTAMYTSIGAAVAALPNPLPEPYVIEIRDGATYTENLTIGVSASATNTLTIRSTGGSRPLLDGGGAAAINLTSSDTTIEGLRIRSGIWMTGVTRAVVRGCELFDGLAKPTTLGNKPSNVFAHHATYNVMERNVIRSSGYAAAGVSFRGDSSYSEYNTVKNNLFVLDYVGGGGYGLHMGRGSRNNSVLNNTFIDTSNLAGGILIAHGEASRGAGPDNVYRNNILATTTSNSPDGRAIAFRMMCIREFPPCGPVTVDNNVYFIRGTNAVAGYYRPYAIPEAFYATLAAWRTALQTVVPLVSGQEANGVDGDPKFVDPAASPPDLRILVGGAGVDRGADLSALGVTADYAGTARPIGAAFDMGAYEGTVSLGGDTTPPVISATCADPPSGQSCTGPNELTVAASETCASPALMSAPLANVTDDSPPVTTCWRAVSANSCALNFGWPSSFSLGSTVVPFLAVDNLGNAADAGLTVKVLDQAPPAAPTLALLPSVVADAGSPKVLAIDAGSCDIALQATSGSVTVNHANYWDAGSTDNCSAPTILTPSPSVIAAGQSAVATWTARDNAGNTSVGATKTICARDEAPPTISLPGAASATCEGVTTRVTLSAPTVSDDNDPAPTWRWEFPDGGAISDCDAGSGVLGNVSGVTTLCGVFPSGTSAIRVRATDTFGNVALSTNRSVIVNDTVAPVALFVSQSPNAAVTNAASVVTTWSVSDTCSGAASPALAVSHTGQGDAGWNDAGTYEVATTTEGNHIITVTAQDQTGNSANAARSFTVDRTRPLLLTSSTLASTNPARPDWFFYNSTARPPTWAAADGDGGAVSGVVRVQIDVWRNGVAAPDAGANVLVLQTGAVASTGSLCEIFAPGSLCRTDTTGDVWDFRRLGPIGDYELFVTVQDLAGNFAAGSVAIDGGPREARKYYIKVARLAQAIDEAVSTTDTLGDGGTISWRAYMATARRYAENMRNAWAHESARLLPLFAGDAPTAPVFASDWGYSWDAGDRPWESLPASARRTLLLDQTKFDPRQGLRGRMLGTAIEQMGSYFATIEAAISDPTAGATASNIGALRWTKWALSKALIGDADLYLSHIEDAGWTRTTYGRWGNHKERANTLATEASQLLDSADAGADYTNAWWKLGRVAELVMKAEYDYDVPFALNQFATHPITRKKKLPAQIAIDSSTRRIVALWKRLAAEERAWASVDAAVPPGTAQARRFIGDAVDAGGLIEQAWPPLRRNLITGDPYAYDAGAQYIAATAGSAFDGVVPVGMVKPDGGGTAYLPPGAASGQYMRFANIDSILATIAAFRFCRNVGGQVAGCEVGETCNLFDPARPLTGTQIPSGCDPNASGYDGKLHGYVPSLVVADDGDASINTNPVAQSVDVWNCPANGWCPGPWSGGSARPSPAQYAGALFAMTELVKHVVAKQSAGAGIDTTLNGLVFGLTERIFAIAAPATALTCPQAATEATGLCRLDDAGASEIATICADAGLEPARCQKMGETRNTLRSEWGASLRYTAACYDSTILDCPTDGGTGNCICNTESPVPACATGTSDISSCCVDACDVISALAILSNNLCNFQHVLNLAFQNPLGGGTNAFYYQIPSFSGYNGCPPTE